jgi:Kef-type K+ transport system membrane component KefB
MLEIQASDPIKTGRPAVLAGIFGVVLPIGLGAVVGLQYGESLARAEFLGIVLAAMSVSISAQTLMELDVLLCPRLPGDDRPACGCAYAVGK